MPTHRHCSEYIRFFCLNDRIAFSTSHGLLLSQFALTDCVIIVVVALFALHCYSAIRLSSLPQVYEINSFIHDKCGPK